VLRLKAVLFFFLLVFGVGFILFPQQSAADELRYGRFSPFCPYTCDFEKTGLRGTVIEIFMAVAKMNGMTYRDVPVPSKRKYRALDEDFSNVTTVWSTNAKAMARTITAQEAIVASRFATAAKINFDFKFRTLKDIKSVHLVTGDGTDFGGELAKYMRDIKNASKVTLLHGKNLGPRGLTIISRDRADVFLSGMDPLAFRIKKFGYEGKIKATHAPYLGTALVYPGFSKKNPKAQQWADMFTGGIRKLRKSGQLAKILNRYGLSDWADEEKSASAK